MDRRTNLRLRKNLPGTIIIENMEYTATVINISAEGIAFVMADDVDLNLGDKVIITVVDDYKTILEDHNMYVGSLYGFIRNINPANTKDSTRVGCIVNNMDYNRYVQEQYTAVACGVR